MTDAQDNGTHDSEDSKAEPLIMSRSPAERNLGLLLEIHAERRIGPRRWNLLDAPPAAARKGSSHDTEIA